MAAGQTEGPRRPSATKEISRSIYSCGASVFVASIITTNGLKLGLTVSGCCRTRFVLMTQQQPSLPDAPAVLPEPATTLVPVMADRFFDEREDQSEVKARIVTKYFFVWAKIIAPWAKKSSGQIGYVDLFAGPGRYKDGSASTPLMVLEAALKDPDLRSMLVTWFNDEDPSHTTNLNAEIAKLPGIASMKFPPTVQTGDVGGTISKSLQDVSLIPTFSFIDPFGYKGLSLGLVQGVIKDWGCDCVFFFNYNRINAGISNPLVDQHMEALFEKTRADELRKLLPGHSPEMREALILEYLAASIKELGGKYVLPFRFRNSNGTRSTHYLIFVTKNVRGYEIMKDIMAKESSSHDEGVPSFEYSPADASTPLLFSLARPLDKLSGDLMQTFAARTLTMQQIYDEHHVDTPFIKRNYKDVLLKLEANKAIQCDPSVRRKGTFADDVLVTFPKKG
jgi:three-Cys-motif partner protein